MRVFEPLTAGELQECCDAILRLTRARGYPPTIRELQEELGLSSTSIVALRLARLERAGGCRRALGLDARSIVATPGWQAGVVVCYTTSPPRAWVRAVDRDVARRALAKHDPPLDWQEP